MILPVKSLIGYANQTRMDMPNDIYYIIVSLERKKKDNETRAQAYSENRSIMWKISRRESNHC